MLGDSSARVIRPEPRRDPTLASDFYLCDQNFEGAFQSEGHQHERHGPSLAGLADRRTSRLGPVGSCALERRIGDRSGTYFFMPTERFLSLRSDDLHFLHLSALRGLRAPHLRHTWRKSLLFCAICFLVASAMGKVRLRSALRRQTISLR